MAYVSKSQKELQRNWPITSGLTARTTKQEGRVSNLIAEEGSTVPRRYKAGLK